MSRALFLLARSTTTPSLRSTSADIHKVIKSADPNPAVSRIISLRDQLLGGRMSRRDLTPQILVLKSSGSGENGLLRTKRVISA